MPHSFSKRISSLLPVLLFLAAVVAACGGGEEATSTATTAPTTAPTEAPAPTDTPAVESTAPVTDTAPITDTAPMTETAPITDTAPVTKTAAASESATVARIFVIDQSQSEARFTLDEKLMGQPKTVVGVTKLVEGSLMLDPADLSKTTLSPIQIDARDFTTDNNMRNNAIRRFVLQSNNDEYRYILFTPTALEGLPATGKAGDSISFQITGDLTISGVTKPVTFAITVTADSDSQLSGLAKAQVLRSDFNLTIPNVPSVADVTDEIQLELQFVATAQ